MKSLEDLVVLYEQRKAAAGAVAARAREVLAHYDGDVAVPLPELDKNEKIAVANLFAQGIDQHGMRIASTLPHLWSPALRSGVKVSERRARDRRMASAGWWERNEYELLTHQRARWLVAYASTPVMIRPHPVWRIPQWQIRNPLEAYPAPVVNSTDMCPDDVIFAVDRTSGWLARNYPEVAQTALMFAAQRWISGKPQRDMRVEVLEYVDNDEISLLAMGVCDPKLTTRGNYGQTTVVNLGAFGGGGDFRWVAPLERLPNRAGMCTAVVPGRITLGNPKGQFDDMIGLFQQQAKLMAMEVNAVARSIWPDTWLVGRQGETPKIVTMADGLKGVVGKVSGGDIKDLNTQPGFQVYPTIDRIERAQRLSGGIPSEFGGESGSNIRTGRRGDSVLAAAVDFPTQEAQLLLERSAVHELERAQAIAKTYFGRERKSFYVSWSKANGQVDYTPDEAFEDGSKVLVKYPSPGSDLNGLSIRTATALGNRLISRTTARERDPEIDDPELEKDRITDEQFDELMFATVAQEVNNPQSGWTSERIARLKKLVRTDDLELDEAIVKLQKEIQDEQAQAAQTPPEALAPEQMPGVNGPVEVPPVVPKPSPSVENLARVFSLARRPQMALPVERTPVA